MTCSVAPKPFARPRVKAVFPAPSAGISALSTVETQIGAYVPYVRSLIYVIAGIVAVIGSINVYMKMNNGDQDVSKSIMMLVGACLFLVAAATALPKFFGLP